MALATEKWIIVASFFRPFTYFCEQYFSFIRPRLNIIMSNVLAVTVAVAGIESIVLFKNGKDGQNRNSLTFN